MVGPPLWKNMTSSIGMMRFPNIRENKNWWQPNHQPAMRYVSHHEHPRISSSLVFGVSWRSSRKFKEISFYVLNHQSLKLLWVMGVIWPGLLLDVHCHRKKSHDHWGFHHRGTVANEFWNLNHRFPCYILLPHLNLFKVYHGLPLDSWWFPEMGNPQ